jgi:hypothetical protein
MTLPQLDYDPAHGAGADADNIGASDGYVPGTSAVKHARVWMEA